MMEMARIIAFTPYSRRLPIRASWYKNQQKLRGLIDTWIFLSYPEVKYPLPPDEKITTLDVATNESWRLFLQIFNPHRSMYSHIAYIQDDVIVSEETILKLIDYEVATCRMVKENGEEVRNIFDGLVQQENLKENGFVKGKHPDRFFICKERSMPLDLTPLMPVEISMTFSNIFYRYDLTVLHLDRKDDF